MKKAIVLLAGMLVVASLFLPLGEPKVSPDGSVSLIQKGVATYTVTYKQGSYEVVEIGYWLNVTEDMKMKFSTNGDGIRYTAEWYVDGAYKGKTTDITAIGGDYSSAPSILQGARNMVIKWNVTGTKAGSYEIRAFARYEWDPDVPGGQGTLQGATEATTLTVANKAPNKPVLIAPENGAIDVEINANLAWQCADRNGDALTYDVYFGTNPDSLPKFASRINVSTYSPGGLSPSTKYYWKVNVSDGALTNVSDVWNFTTSAAPNRPPEKPTITGPGKGDVGGSYSFQITSTDPDGNQIKYAIDWDGDGTIDYNTTYTASGSTIKVSHVWPDSGNYIIKVKAIDERSAQSDWAEHRIVIVEKLYGIVDSDGDGLPDAIEDRLGTNKNVKDAIEVSFKGGYGFIIPDKDIYYNWGTNKTSPILKKDVNGDGIIDYVFDADGDGKYDHWYDGTSGEIKPYEPSKPFDWWYLIVIACFIATIVIAIYGVKRLRR